MVIWGGHSQDLVEVSTGATYDPVTDTWENISAAGAPSPRSKAQAVWTGKEVLIWSGKPTGGDPQEWLSDGALYDPVLDTWRAAAATGPTSGTETAVWADGRLMVWAGDEGGWMYNPEIDTWRQMNPEGAPALWPIAMAWTGTEIVLWGGSYSDQPTVGARYRPPPQD